jgi:hypothetical protein
MEISSNYDLFFSFSSKACFLTLTIGNQDLTRKLRFDKFKIMRCTDTFANILVQLFCIRSFLDLEISTFANFFETIFLISISVPSLYCYIVNYGGHGWGGHLFIKW